jgi:SLT domain-containing protein
VAEGFRIASAYVVVSPDLDEFERDLKAKLDAATAGAEAKVRITGDNDGLNRVIEDSVDRLGALDGLEARARITGDNDGLMRSAREARDELDRLDGATARARLELEDADFRRQLAEDEAEARAFGNSSFHPLIAMATAGITAGIPGIGGAITGLGALGAAGGLAFSGISSAVQAAQQQSAGAGQAGAQLAATEFSNSVAISQAQQSVAQARQQAAHDAITAAQQIASAESQLTVTERDTAAQQVQALESVTAAHHQVGQAEQTLTQAQYQLSQAYIQARQNIIALNDQLADQKLGVEGARLAVEQAELTQRQVDANALSTDLQRQQAALAVAQAKQQLTDATDQEKATQQQATAANKAGVDGSQQVIQAKNAEAQAQYALAQAQQAYRDSQSALTRTELDDAAQVRAAQQQVAQARQQAAYQQQADAQRVSQAEQNLSDTIRQQQLQMAAAGGAAATLTASMAGLSPEAQRATFEILAMRGSLHQLEDTAQAAVLPGFTVLLEGVQSILPEVNAGIAVFGQEIGNTFAQAGQAMQTSGFKSELTGLIENGIAFDTTIVPGVEHLASALLDAGSQKGAVDGLASGIRGIEDGLTGVVTAVTPFEAGVGEVLSSVGVVADAVGKPLGTLAGVIGEGLSPALHALDPVILQVGDDLVMVFSAARPVLDETGQIIADLAPGASIFASVLTGTLVGALDVVGVALKPIDAFASSGFGKVVAGEVGLAVTALGAWKLANSALGLGTLVDGVKGAYQWVRDFQVATEGATLAEKGMLAGELAFEAINPFVWAGIAAVGVTALGIAILSAKDRTQDYINELTQADHATGFNIAGYEHLAAQLHQAAQAQDEHTAALYRAGAAGKASAGVTAVSTTRTHELTSAQVEAQAEADRLTGALGTLEQRYGLTSIQAEQLATAAGVQAKTLADGGSAAGAAMQKIEAYADANLRAHDPVAKTNQDFATLANNALTASSRTNALDDAFQSLVGNFVSSEQTRLQVNQDLLTLASNAGQAGASLGGTNQASITLGESFYQTINDIDQHARAMVNDGDSAQQVRDYLAQATAKLGPYAKGSQAATQAIQDMTRYVDGLTQSLTQMPKAEKTAITVTGVGDWTIVNNRNPNSGPGGGHQLTRATGGPIHGPGGPTADRIPLWGSDGEFMMSAAAVDRYGEPLFEALNAQRLAAGGPVTGSYKGSVQGLPAWDAKELQATTNAIAGGVAAAFAASASTQSVNAPGTVRDWISQGMRIAGRSGADWTDGLTIIAMGESGGSQSVVNTTDINARNGTPSGGLMQFIQPTFARYAMPGYQVWMNPVDQVVADAWDRGYINERYGGIDNVPGVIAVRKGLPYVGYDGGGWLPPGLPFNATGRPEAVLTPDESAALVTMARHIDAQGTGGAGGSTVIHNDLHFHGPQMPGPELMEEIYRKLALAAG